MGLTSKYALSKKERISKVGLLCKKLCVDVQKKNIGDDLRTSSVFRQLKNTTTKIMNGREFENHINEIQQKISSLSLTNPNLIEKEECKKQNNQINKCREWLETVSDQSSSECSCSDCSCSDCSTATTEDSSIVDENLCLVMNNMLSTSLENYTNGGKIRNIMVSKSEGIHIGPNYQFNAPVNIVKHVLSINDRENPDCDAIEEHLNENKNNLTPHVVSRRTWLAQPPLVPHTVLQGPAKYVIICHTATEEGFSISENTFVIRLIQNFHIVSRKWNDIGYNFLVGSDGKVYEGRGFNTVGAHTKSYNANSLGIAFVGSFVNKLPPAEALIEAQRLIALGVSVGAVAENYSLVAHCQLSHTLSPGNMLYEEIKKWDNWDPL